MVAGWAGKLMARHVGIGTPPSELVDPTCSTSIDHIFHMAIKFQHSEIVFASRVQEPVLLLVNCNGQWTTPLLCLDRQTV